MPPERQAQESTGRSRSDRGGYAGGPATAGGTGFQDGVTAWLAAVILAEAEAVPPWSLPAATTLEAVEAETDHPVDDIALETSDGVRVRVQAKVGLTLAGTPQGTSRGSKSGKNAPTPRLSPLGSALDQAVRAYLRDAGAGQQTPAWPPYILAAGPGSSLPVTEHLRRSMDRLRTVSPRSAVSAAAVNADERAALDAAAAHVRAAWTRAGADAERRARGVEPRAHRRPRGVRP